MIESIVVYMQALIAEYGALGVFAATMIEEIIAPVPSPIVPLSAGFFMFGGDTQFYAIALSASFSIALPVALGLSIGSAAVYGVGFYGGKPLILRFEKLLGLRWSDIQRIEERVTQGVKDEIVLFILRILPVVPGVAISGFCGIVRYPFSKFMAITFVGGFIRALLLGVLGWYVGELYHQYADFIAHTEKYILAGLLVLAAIGGVYWFFRSRGKNNIQEEMVESNTRLE